MMTNEQKINRQLRSILRQILSAEDSQEELKNIRTLLEIYSDVGVRYPEYDFDDEVTESSYMSLFSVNMGLTKNLIYHLNSYLKINLEPCNVFISNRYLDGDYVYGSNKDLKTLKAFLSYYGIKICEALCI